MSPGLGIGTAASDIGTEASPLSGPEYATSREPVQRSALRKISVRHRLYGAKPRSPLVPICATVPPVVIRVSSIKTGRRGRGRPAISVSTGTRGGHRREPVQGKAAFIETAGSRCRNIQATRGAPRSAATGANCSTPRPRARTILPDKKAVEFPSLPQ
jgi:hypothetical protein